MSDELERFAEGLVLETLTEAAQTFFGARRELECEIECYREAAKRLAGVERVMLRKAGAVHYLLLEGEAAREFYQALGAPPGHLPDMAEPDKSGLRKSWAITGSGRFGKLLFRAYEALHQAADEYTNGRYYNDPRGTGRKLVTVHFTQLRSWCKRLNQRIEAVNAENLPSATLCFVQGLDPDSLDRARITGGSTFGPSCSLDRDLAFPPIECVAMTYVAAPELPAPDAARKSVLAFAARLYKANRERIDQLLAAW
ncbi:MAG: hypothetical protein AB1916_12265 [Thermodesulfobacteriota bacterium]